MNCLYRWYSKPIDYWISVLSQAGDLKHMALVAHLKEQHLIGHGHAKALVAVFLAKRK
jgi:hypothetical protein